MAQTLAQEEANRAFGQHSRLSEKEVQAIISFLRDLGEQDMQRLLALYTKLQENRLREVLTLEAFFEFIRDSDTRFADRLMQAWLAAQKELQAEFPGVNFGAHVMDVLTTIIAGLNDDLSVNTLSLQLGQAIVVIDTALKNKDFVAMLNDVDAAVQRLRGQKSSTDLEFASAVNATARVAVIEEKLTVAKITKMVESEVAGPVPTPFVRPVSKVAATELLHERNQRDLAMVINVLDDGLMQRVMQAYREAQLLSNLIGRDTLRVNHKIEPHVATLNFLVGVQNYRDAGAPRTLLGFGPDVWNHNRISNAVSSEREMVAGRS